MSIVKYKNKSGVTYAYESVSVWDPEKKQARPKRTYLGRVDDETGEIIATPRKRGRRPQSESAPADDCTENIQDYKVLYEECSAKLEKAQKEITELKKDKASLEVLNLKMKNLLASISRQAGEIL